MANTENAERKSEPQVRCDYGLAARWTQEQKDKAWGIVNDIAEDIDNHETRAELRQALSIYADMHHDALQKRACKKTEKLMEQVNKLAELMVANDPSSATRRAVARRQLETSMDKKTKRQTVTLKSAIAKGGSALVGGSAVLGAQLAMIKARGCFRCDGTNRLCNICGESARACACEDKNFYECPDCKPSNEKGQP